MWPAGRGSNKKSTRSRDSSRSFDSQDSSYVSPSSGSRAMGFEYPTGLTESVHDQACGGFDGSPFSYGSNEPQGSFDTYQGSQTMGESSLGSSFGGIGSYSSDVHMSSSSQAVNYGASGSSTSAASTSYRFQTPKHGTLGLSNLGSPEHWTSQDIIEWARLVATGNNIEVPPRFLAMAEILTGQILATLEPINFIEIFGGYGPIFHEAFQEQRRSTDDEYSSNVFTQKVPGKAGNERGPICWEFLVHLLISPQTCPSHVCWVDEHQYTFRLVQKDKIVSMWASRREGKKVEYINFARALRYHYNKTGALKAVSSKQLVYQLGPQAIEYYLQLKKNES